MVDSDYNIIKPVETLQNVTSITPAKKREKRKKRQNTRDQGQWQPETNEDQLNKSNEEDINRKNAENGKTDHIIDYRA